MDSESKFKGEPMPLTTMDLLWLRSHNKVEELEKKLADLKENFDIYAQHHPGCRGPAACTCGLHDILEAYDA